MRRGLGRGSARAPNIDPHDMKLMIATNFEGLVNMTQAVLPIFLRRSNGGRGDVINIGSIAARDPYPNSSIYCATKAAVRSFTENLRREYIASQIRFSEIAPGQVKTVCLLVASLTKVAVDTKQEWSAMRHYGNEKKAQEGFECVEHTQATDYVSVNVNY